MHDRVKITIQKQYPTFIGVNRSSSLMVSRGLDDGHQFGAQEGRSHPETIKPNNGGGTEDNIVHLPNKMGIFMQ